MKSKRLSLIAAASCLCLLLSSCGIVRTLQNGYRELENGASLATGAWDTVTGWCEDSAGEVIGVCCSTACVKAENAKEFKNEFISGLNDALSSNPAARARLGEILKINEEVAETCSDGAPISFIRTDSFAGTTTTSDPIDLDEDALGESPTDAGQKAREAFVQALTTAVDAALADTSNSIKITITIKTCPPKVQPPEPESNTTCEPTDGAAINPSNSLSQLSLDSAFESLRDLVGQNEQEEEEEEEENDESPKGHQTSATLDTYSVTCETTTSECCELGEDRDEEITIDASGLLDEVIEEHKKRRKRRR